MNVSNNSTLQSESTSPQKQNETSVILSIVMPIILILFCIGYAAWDMERTTRPDKEDKKQRQRKQPQLKSQNTLKVQPITLTQEVKEDQPLKILPITLTQEVKEDNLEESKNINKDTICRNLTKSEKPNERHKSELDISPTS